jgi:hypothetical protein
MKISTRMQHQLNTYESFGPNTGILKTNNKMYYMMPMKQDSDMIKAEDNAYP